MAKATSTVARRCSLSILEFMERTASEVNARKRFQRDGCFFAMKREEGEAKCRGQSEWDDLMESAFAIRSHGGVNFDRMLGSNTPDPNPIVPQIQ